MFQEGIKLDSECGLTHFLPKPLSKDFSLLERGLCLVAQLCPTLAINRLLPARLLYPWDSPGKNI